MLKGVASQSVQRGRKHYDPASIYLDYSRFCKSLGITPADYATWFKETTGTVNHFALAIEQERLR